MTMEPGKPLTAITLIDWFEECCPSDVRTGLWDEADTRHNRSSLCRLRQLKSLFRTFEIPFDPAAFERPVDGHAHLPALHG